MKRIITAIFIFVTLLASFHQTYAQQHDRHWIGGYGWPGTPGDDAVLMVFGEDGITYTEFHSEIYIVNGAFAISNAEGELQFYTNGNVAASWDHQVMQGGKGFNEGASSDDFGVNGMDTTLNYFYNPYTYQVIPDAYDENIYYMVHAFILEYGDCQHLDMPKMQISKIDMSANGGKGRVVYKNRPFAEGLYGRGFALVRHGNGRDWWVVLRNHEGQEYRALLLQRDSVVRDVVSNIPGLDMDISSFDDCFVTSTSLLEPSPDGSLLIDKYGANWAKLMTFDRCSGEVALVDTFANGITPLVTSGGVVINTPVESFQFSASGRYLYGAGYAEIAQWDLWADDIGASKIQLGGVPWALSDSQEVMVGITGGLSAFGLGPDGKIYNLYRTAHSMIKHPDEPGEASGYCIAADSPPSCLSVPYWLFSNRHPNFRLGPV